MTESKNVFVIMPFSSTTTCTDLQWTEIFEEVFKPAVEAAGFSCERAVPEMGSLIGSIVEKLRHSRIVLADITDRNPNVFYELGVRHSLSKRTIIVTQNSEHVPSDLRGYWFVNYGTSPRQVVEFRKEVARLISSIESNPDKADNPVADYLDQENINITKVINSGNVKKLNALYTEFSGNLIVLRQVLDSQTSPRLISTDCLRLLLRTLYLDLGSDLLKDLYELHNKLRILEFGLSSHTFIESTIEDLQRLSNAIFDIRNRLAKDEYKEPENLTSMIWKPSSLTGSDITLKLYACQSVPPESTAREMISKYAALPPFFSCVACDGTGKCLNCSKDFEASVLCEKCNGSGHCMSCSGTG